MSTRFHLYSSVSCFCTSVPILNTLCRTQVYRGVLISRVVANLKVVCHFINYYSIDKISSSTRLARMSGSFFVYGTCALFFKFCSLQRTISILCTKSPNIGSRHTIRLKNGSQHCNLRTSDGRVNFIW